MNKEILFLIIKIVIYTVLIIGLVFLSKKLAEYSQKNGMFGQNPNKKIKIKERLYLDRNSSLNLIEIEDEQMLLAVSQNNVSVIWKRRNNENNEQNE